MSTRYIPQLNETNFVFPNYEISEYDVDIIHSLNENSISGTVTNFIVSGTPRSTGITITHDYTWSQNGALTYITPINNMRLLSVHALAPSQIYYKPWRLVDVLNVVSPYSSSYSGSNTIVLTPANLGLSALTSGTYYFEVRFIGLKSIFPVCQTLQISVT